MQTAKLIVVGTGRAIALHAELISVGRGSKNDIVVTDPEVSRRHALIRRDGDTYWIEDQGGASGTLVNDKKYVGERVALSDGDVIVMGSTEFTFALVGRDLEAQGDSGAGELSITGMVEALNQSEGQGADQNSGDSVQREPGEITVMLSELDDQAVAEAAHKDRQASGVEEPDGPEVASEERAVRAELRVTGGAAQGTIFEVTEAQKSVIGRSASNSIAIEDDEISRRHCEIEFRDGAFWLSDLGSANGTRVNGAPLNEPYALRDGDLIQIGQSELEVRVGP